MALFKRSNGEKRVDDKKLNYYMHRDSLTGQMDKGFAVAEFERLLNCSAAGGVMVHLDGADNMPFYKAEHYIKLTAQLMVSISNCEVARLEEGYFVVFCENWEHEAEKLRFFLEQTETDEMRFSVGAKQFDEHEKDFDVFVKRLKRNTHAYENSKLGVLARDLPIK